MPCPSISPVSASVTKRYFSEEPVRGIPLSAMNSIPILGATTMSPLPAKITLLPWVKFTRLGWVVATAARPSTSALGEIAVGTKFPRPRRLEPDQTMIDIRKVETVVKGGVVLDAGAIYRALGVQPATGN